DRLEFALLRLSRERALLRPLPVDVLGDRSVEENHEGAPAIFLPSVDVTETVGQRFVLLSTPSERARRFRRAFVFRFGRAFRCRRRGAAGGQASDEGNGGDDPEIERPLHGARTVARERANARA